jgi:hypothetical protein
MKNGERVGTLSRTTHGAEFVYDETFRAKCLENGSIGVACTLSAYSQKIGHLFAERSATPGQPVDNLVIPVFTSL